MEWAGACYAEHKNGIKLEEISVLTGQLYCLQNFAVRKTLPIIIDNPNSILQLLFLIDPVIHRDGRCPGKHRHIDSVQRRETCFRQHPPEPFCLLPAGRCSFALMCSVGLKNWIIDFDYRPDFSINCGVHVGPWITGVPFSHCNISMHILRALIPGSQAW